MYIYDKIEEGEYIKFIEYACKESNMYSFVIKKYNENCKKQLIEICKILGIKYEDIKIKFDNEKFIKRIEHKLYLQSKKIGIDGLTIGLKQCLENKEITEKEFNEIRDFNIKNEIETIVYFGGGFQIYKKRTDEIIKSLEKDFIEKKIENKRNSEGYEEVYYYRISDEIRNYMLKKNIFLMKFPYYPEDIRFYKQGKLWIDMITHEEMCAIYPKNQEELKKIKEINIQNIMT